MSTRADGRRPARTREWRHGKGHGSGTGDTGRRNGAAPDPLLPPAEVGGSEARGSPGERPKRGPNRGKPGGGAQRGSTRRRRFEVARGGRGHTGPALSYAISGR